MYVPSVVCTSYTVYVSVINYDMFYGKVDWSVRECKEHTGKQHFVHMFYGKVDWNVVTSLCTSPVWSVHLILCT